MKTILFVTVLVAVLLAAYIMNIDAITAALKAYPFAEVGYLTGTFIGTLLKIEIAKLMFWIHLFS